MVFKGSIVFFLLILFFSYVSFVQSIEPPNRGDSESTSNDEISQKSQSRSDTASTTPGNKNNDESLHSKVSEDENNENEEKFLSPTNVIEQKNTELKAPVTNSSENSTESKKVDKLDESDSKDQIEEKIVESDKNEEKNQEIDIDQVIAKKSVEEVMNVLNKLADEGNNNAKLKLALWYFYGNFELDLEMAYKYFVDLAEKGNSIANMYLGVMHSLGLPPVKSNQAKALLYYTFASLANQTYARMALGYRYLYGINVAANCEFALSYYRKVAKRVEQSHSFTQNPIIQRIRLLDETENSGSYSSTLDDDLIQYYQFLADKGDISAQVGLGHLHLQGVRGVTQNQYRAYHYFKMAAESGNTNAMAYLGKIHLEGNTVVEQSYEKAYKYFKMAAEKGNPIGQSGLGVMHLSGRGVQKDFKTAFKYFTQAAMQGWVDGQLYLGIMYLNGFGVTKDYKAAIKYFTMASQSGHILGFYYLGEMHATGTGTIRTCSTAVELFKSVSERGEWSSLMMEAHNDYKEGRRANAFIKYAVLSELGYEVAQSNAAFMLDRDEIPEMFNKQEVHSRAFMFWTRSAAQGYSVARVKLGDYHFYGLGTDVDYKLAANQYRIASETQDNAQALFNLGYMYETGLGLNRDIYLAKRYYDLAAITSSEAQVPVTLALIKLFFIYFYDYMKGMSFKNIFKSSSDFFVEDWDLYFVTFGAIIIATIYFYRRQVGG